MQPKQRAGKKGRLGRGPRRAGEKFSADVAGWKTRDARVARAYRVKEYALPNIGQVRAQARSAAARSFLSSKYYSGQMEQTVLRFNKNPFSLFPLWKNAAREFLLLAQQMRGKKHLNPQEMRKFADAFFREYQSNALVESVQGPKLESSFIIPSISRGRFEVSRLYEASKCPPTLNNFFRPAIRELMASAHDRAMFEETITRFLWGQSQAHSNVTKVLYEKGHPDEAYDATDAYMEQRIPRLLWEEKLKTLEKQGKRKEADKLRANDLLSRQMETINDIHGTIGTVLGKDLIKSICDRYIKEHGIKDIPKDLWAPAKLALIGKKLHGE